MQTHEIKETARIYALQNAVQFNGIANAKSVIGKVIGVLQKKGVTPIDIIPIVNSVVEEVNKIPIEKQISELEKIAPDLLKKEKKERDFSLPKLPNAEKGKVITRFPPEPNGYLHIGHAKAAIVDYEYAKKYNGKFILRFDDTNPENIHLEFYESQKKDLKWLGLEWDIEYCTSNNIEKHYRLADQLIDQGNAYICDCSPGLIKNGRFHQKECICRKNSTEKNMNLWNDLLSSSIKNMVLRLKGNMNSDNTAMRDPTLFRIIDKPHPIQGDKYRVWPTYDFAGAVEDSISGVTHPFRTKEYELRDECYFYILDLLGLRKPHLLEFARLTIEGLPVSKRKIKPLIEAGSVSGYDDIRLPTLRGLNKRGILPEAIKQFVLTQGISKVESTTTFSLIESANRKILDPISKRYFFVVNPVNLIVENAPKLKKSIRLHPTDKKIGSRIIKTDKTFYVSGEDIKSMGIGDVFRLKDLYNVEIKDKNDVVIAKYKNNRLIPDSVKIQWTTDDYIEMDVFIPKNLYKDGKFNPDSLEKVHGFAEDAVATIKNGEIIQFERFGFVKIENIKSHIVGFFAHK
jgi:glutamyl-tRNA synthetase